MTRPWSGFLRWLVASPANFLLPKIRGPLARFHLWLHRVPFVNDVMDLVARRRAHPRTTLNVVNFRFSVFSTKNLIPQIAIVDEAREYFLTFLMYRKYCRSSSSLSDQAACDNAQPVAGRHVHRLLEFAPSSLGAEDTRSFSF